MKVKMHNGDEIECTPEEYNKVVGNYAETPETPVETQEHQERPLCRTRAWMAVSLPKQKSGKGGNVCSNNVRFKRKGATYSINLPKDCPTCKKEIITPKDAFEHFYWRLCKRSGIMNASKSKCYNAVVRDGISNRKDKKWNVGEKKQLKQLFASNTRIEEIAKTLNRTKSAVTNKAYLLGLTNRKQKRTRHHTQHPAKHIDYLTRRMNWINNKAKQYCNQYKINWEKARSMAGVEWSGMNKQQQPQPQTTPKMPNLDISNQSELISLVTNAVKSGRQIKMWDAQSCLQLEGGQGWNETNWGRFVTRFLLSADKISEHMGIQNRFKIVADGNLPAIAYEV